MYKQRLFYLRNPFKIDLGLQGEFESGDQAQCNEKT